MEEDEDALSLQIGRVARAHVDLDNALRNLFRTLVSPSPAMYLANDITSTNRLVADCHTMLSRTSIESGLRDAGLDALSAAKVANEERNRVVHDMWLPEIRLESDASPRWEVLQLQKTSSSAVSRDLDSVRSVLAALKRVALRVSGLDTALWMTLPHLRDRVERPGETPVDTRIALAADEFELLEGGAFRVAGHEPVRLIVLPGDDDE